MRLSIRSLSLQAAFFLFAVWTTFSCSAPSHVTYFQDLRPGESEQKVIAATEIKVRPGDKLSIIVNSRDPQLSQLFNLPYVTQQIGQVSASKGSGSVSSSSQGISGYTVDEKGMIDFPVLGKIEIAGKTAKKLPLLSKESCFLKIW